MSFLFLLKFYEWNPFVMDRGIFADGKLAIYTLLFCCEVKMAESDTEVKD